MQLLSSVPNSDITIVEAMNDEDGLNIGFFSVVIHDIRGN